MVKASAANAIDAVDISKPRFKANPYPFYAQLRAEHPVFPVKLPDGQTAWLITRYDDALSALKDRRFSKDKLNAGQKQPWTPAFFKPLSRNMLDVDDPDHARLRGLVHKVFTPKMVENMRQRVESLTEQLLDAVQPRGRMDLVREYSGELGHPFHVVDEDLVVLSLDHPFISEGRFASLLVRDRELAQKLAEGFQTLWSKAMRNLREIDFHPGVSAKRGSPLVGHS